MNFPWHTEETFSQWSVINPGKLLKYWKRLFVPVATIIYIMTACWTLLLPSSLQPHTKNSAATLGLWIFSKGSKSVWLLGTKPQSYTKGRGIQLRIYPDSFWVVSPSIGSVFLSCTVQRFYNKLGSKKWTGHLSPQVSKASVVNILLQGTLALLSPWKELPLAIIPSTILHGLSISNNHENYTAQ